MKLKATELHLFSANLKWVKELMDPYLVSFKKLDSMYVNYFFAVLLYLYNLYISNTSQKSKFIDEWETHEKKHEKKLPVDDKTKRNDSGEQI